MAAEFREERFLTTQPVPSSLTADEGPSYWFLGGLCTVKATTESTGGAYSLTHEIMPPGHATPYHMHHREDEAFWVLDGQFTFICDGRRPLSESEDTSSCPAASRTESALRATVRQPCSSSPCPAPASSA